MVALNRPIRYIATPITSASQAAPTKALEGEVVAAIAGSFQGVKTVLHAWQQNEGVGRLAGWPSVALRWRNSGQQLCGVRMWGDWHCIRMRMQCQSPGFDANRGRA